MPPGEFAVRPQPMILFVRIRLRGLHVPLYKIAADAGHEAVADP